MKSMIEREKIGSVTGETKHKILTGELVSADRWNHILSAAVTLQSGPLRDVKQRPLRLLLPAPPTFSSVKKKGEIQFHVKLDQVCFGKKFKFPSFVSE